MTSHYLWWWILEKIVRTSEEKYFHFSFNVEESESGSKEAIKKSLFMVLDTQINSTYFLEPERTPFMKIESRSWVKFGLIVKRD